MIRSLVVGIAIALASSASASPQVVPHLRRVAIVIGANDPPPGHQALRFAHDDAMQMSDVLRRVGQFADVRVLLDPHPSELLALVQEVDDQARATGGDGLVLFYYSGHSDGQSIFPHGEKLAIAEVRARLARMNARIRVGILDTCRGGGWTQTKGLTIGPALDPIDLLDVATEGTALIASSAGLENAHETDTMHGSFFTHHFTAGLLGAADRSGDGEVTLQEAFEYAKERTVRDTALLAPTPQHPSFDLQLHGRQDIVLASLGASTSALEIAAPRAVLQVIHLESGLIIAEAPPSTKPLRLAVAPGGYLVRRVDGSQIWAKQVRVGAGETIKLTETELELSGTTTIAVKGITPIAPATLPAGMLLLQLGAGVTTGPARLWGPSDGIASAITGESFSGLERSFAATGSLTYAITDRLTWAVPVPAFAYRFGTAGAVEVVPYGGVISIGYSTIEGLITTLDTGASIRAWATPKLSAVAVADARWDHATKALEASTEPRGILTLSGSLGVEWEADPLLTLNFAAGAAVPYRTVEAPPMASALSSSLTIGSFQTIGFRALPLIQVHLTPRLSLDGYASWSIDLHGAGVRDLYLGGFSWAW